MIEAILILACLQSDFDLVAGEVRKLGGEMRFTEGPAADGRGNVYFTDIPNNRIMKWDGKELSVWRENSGAANGIRVDRDGSLVVCEGGNRRVTRITMDQQVTVLAESYEGKKLNSPNDLCFDGKGGIYFTDPRYGKGEGMEQDKEAVYYIPPGGGKLLRVADDMVRPNGIEMGKDRLYIADAGGGKVYRCAVNADGTLGERQEHAPVACDGMKLDEKGNLYTTTRRGVEVFDPEGKPLGVIEVPEKPANVCFDGNVLYITARTSLYAVELKVKGR